MKNKKIFLLIALTLFLTPLVNVNAESNYTCPEGKNVIKSGNTYKCCSGKAIQGVENGYCYTEIHGGKSECPKGTGETGSSYDWKTGFTKCYAEKAIAATLKDPACFVCGGNSQANGKYIWGVYYSSQGCTKISSYNKGQCTSMNYPLGCYACGNSQGGTYVWGRLSSSSCTLTSKTQSQCVNKKEGDDKLCLTDYLEEGCNNNSVKSLQEKLIYVQGYDKCPITADGSYGPATKNCVMEFQKEKGITADGVAGTVTQNKLNEAYQSKLNANTDTASADTIKYVKVTYNLDGGHFINGETTRNVILTNKDSVTSPATIPGKKDYKFLGWYNGDTKYEFGQTIANDITLIAKWEKIESTSELVSLYCNSEYDVLDYDKKLCITAQQFDATTYSGKVSDLNNTGVLQTIQTKNAFTRVCTNDIYVITADPDNNSGANNTVSCSEGYVRDLWKSEDTCNNLTSCTSTEPNCHRIWNGTCYAGYEALKNNLNISEDLEINGKIIKNIKSTTTIDTVKGKLGVSSGTITALDKNNNAISNRTKLYTGDKLKAEVNGDIYEFTVSVKGDPSGDGKIDAQDIQKMIEHIVKNNNNNKLENEYFEAANLYIDDDTETNSYINDSDIRLIAEHFTKGKEL